MKLKGLYLILMLTIGTALIAQEKYEQAVVMQVAGAPNVICVYIEGKEMDKKKVKVEPWDLTPVLNEIATMRDQGWDVWNSGVSANGLVYFLRRKLK